MGLPISLVRRHNHMNALSALGVAPESPSFPAVVGCPLCQQNALYLFDDIITGGVWLHCNSCLAHGDIITFGATLWNTSLPDLLTKLSDLGVISAGDAVKAGGDYERALARQQGAELFWEEAKAQVWNHSDDVIACRLRELGVHHEVNECAGLVGVAHKDQIVRLCDAVGRAKPRMIRDHAPAVVFPFYDLPGRLTGLLLVQYTEEFEAKKTFIPVAWAVRRKPDAGYFMLDTVMLPNHPTLKNKQFVVEDPFWVLDVQCRQLKYGLPLLPLAASYTGAEAYSYGTNWQSFMPATRLFHHTGITPEIISQACTAKGYACVTPLEARTTVRRTPKSALVSLAKIQSAAETWQQSLHNVLTSANEIEAYAFTTKLTIPHEKLSAFFGKHSDRFSPEFVTRVLNSISVTPAAPTRACKRWVLIENGNSWWNQTGQQVCSAKIVITKVLQIEGGEKFYAGKVFVGDEQLDFTDSAYKIEHMGLMAYAAAISAPHGKLVTFDRAWNKRSHLLAMQLHPPELNVISSKTGWDAQAGLFRLGAYGITNAGEVVQTPTLTHKKAAIYFPEPVPVAPLPIRELLTVSQQNAFAWGVFSVIAADLIAPVVGKDPASTLIADPAFTVAAKIGQAVGCRYEQTSAMQRRDNSNFVLAQFKHDAWPVFISNVFDDSRLNTTISRGHNLPLFLRMPAHFIATATSYGWQGISGVPPAIDTDFSALSYVLPAYIQRALKMRMTLATQHKNLTVSIAHDLHGWLQTTYSTSFNLAQVLRGFTPPEAAHEALMRELNVAIQAGKIDVLPRPRRKDQPSNYILQRKNHWWINQRAVDNYFYNCKNIQPNWLAIVDCFKAAKVLAGDELVHTMPGLLINSEWCDQFWDDNSPARVIG